MGAKCFLDLMDLQLAEKENLKGVGNASALS